MKLSLLKSAACLLFVAALTSCSTESDVDLTNSNTTALDPERLSRSSVWDGEIGVDGDSVYEITADKNLLLADLQNVAGKDAPELISIEIVRKQALNAPSDQGFMLIASGNSGFSIGVMLSRSSSGLLIAERGFAGANPVAVSCKGCASGCNLQYLYISGKRVPICNENGCVADCTKTETEID